MRAKTKRSALRLFWLVLIAGPAWGLPPSQSDRLDDELTRARQLRMSGDLDGAIEELRQALVRFPNRVGLHSELSLCYLRLSRLEQAQACFEKAVELEPDRLVPYLNLADVLSRKNELGTARRILLWASRTHPERAEPYYTMAKIQFRAGRLGNAEHAARQALERDDGKNPEVHILLANIFMAQGEPDETARQLETYLSQAPQGEQAENMRNRLEKLRGQMNRSATPSLAPYRDLIDRYKDGDFIEAASALSGLPRRTIEEAAEGNNRKALSDTNLISAALLHTEAALVIGNQRSFHFRKSIEFLARVGDDSRRLDLERRWFLAMGYYYLGKYRFMVALPFLLEAVKLSPDDLETRLALACAGEGAGLIRGHTSELRQAESQLRKILGEAPDHLEAHLRLGHVLKLRGERDKALEQLQWVLDHSERQDGLLLSHLLIGDIRRQRGELSRAIESYRIAVASDPGCQAAATALSHALHRAGDRAGSRQVLRHFLDEKGNQPGKTDAWWRYLQGHSERFDELLEVVRESDAIIHVVGIQSSAETSLQQTAEDNELSTRANRFLGELADATGGRTWFADVSANLEDVFLGVLEEMESRYLLSYQIQKPLQEGWHSLEVKLKNRKADKIRARTGYMLTRSENR